MSFRGRRQNRKKGKGFECVSATFLWLVNREGWGVGNSGAGKIGSIDFKKKIYIFFSLFP